MNNYLWLKPSLKLKGKMQLVKKIFKRTVEHAVGCEGGGVFSL